MDNITHTLIGISVGQWASEKKVSFQSPIHERAKKRFFIWASIVGNNFPDLDVLYTRITPGPLGSLLHHRGHTHTLVGLIPQCLLIFLLFWLVKRWFGFNELTKDDWKKGMGMRFRDARIFYRLIYLSCDRREV